MTQVSYASLISLTEGSYINPGVHFMLSENVTSFETAGPATYRTAADKSDGQIVTQVDPNSNLIRVVGMGVWTPGYLDLHFNELRRVIAERRMRYGTVNALIDLREAGVQTAEAAARINDGTRSVYTSNDRIAIIVQSSLVKLQMKRVLDLKNLQIFISISAAHTWLTAYA